MADPIPTAQLVEAAYVMRARIAAAELELEQIEASLIGRGKGKHSGLEDGHAVGGALEPQVGECPGVISHGRRLLRRLPSRRDRLHARIRRVFAARCASLTLSHACRRLRDGSEAPADGPPAGFPTTPVATTGAGC